MNSEKSILVTRQLYESGSISREDYWRKLQVILHKIHDLAKLQINHGNTIHVRHGEVICSINLRKENNYNIVIEMILDSHDIRSVPFTVLAHGTYEPFQSHLLIELGKISESFLDIGANAGYYSLVLSQANPKIQICAIEPNPEVFKFLQYNLRLNNCSSRVTTYNLGLSSIDRESILFIPKFTGSGGGSLRPLHSEEGSHSQTTVEVKQLDNLDVRKADLIKMDTEGSEYNILLGGGKTLRDNLPTICCELLRKWMGQFGYSPQDFVNLLAQLHYRCFAIGKDCLREIVEINDRTEETNFIFCQSTNTKHLNVLLPYLKK